MVIWLFARFNDRRQEVGVRLSNQGAAAIGGGVVRRPGIHSRYRRRAYCGLAASLLASLVLAVYLAFTNVLAPQGYFSEPFAKPALPSVALGAAGRSVRRQAQRGIRRGARSGVRVCRLDSRSGRTPAPGCGTDREPSTGGEPGFASTFVPMSAPSGQRRCDRGTGAHSAAATTSPTPLTTFIAVRRCYRT